MDNFTKEYIAECDCAEIQGLKKDYDIGDYYTNSPSDYKEYTVGEIYLFKNQRDERWFAKSRIWLPTGDQLDEEIIKICRKKHLLYDCLYGKLGIWITTTEPDNIIDINRVRGLYCQDANPLIAKIKLLKELLKEDK